MENLLWYLTSLRSLSDVLPFVRAALVCLFMYQLDLVPMLVACLLRKIGVLPGEPHLEPGNRKDAIVVLPTLLRKQDELDGLTSAMLSIASNGYSGRLIVVACIDGVREAAHLYRALSEWAESVALPRGVEFHVVGGDERWGKAVAMDLGVEYVKGLVAAGKLAQFPELFFNMDADSTLGAGAIERIVYRLTRKRWLSGAPYHIVTSNVVVPLEQCYTGWRSLFSLKSWIALSVAREYLGSISAGKVNWKLLPCMEVSGALYCTWSEIYLAAPLYARFIQGLRFRDWLKWWFGNPPPSFSDFRGSALPEAMTGPGDDTWMGWFASCCTWKDGRFSAEFPRTPLHALASCLLQYVSRPVSYDPLAKVYSKTPTTVRALFKQRLRWNSSRMQDLLRHGPSLIYHWKAGVPLGLGTVVVFTAITMFATAPFAWLLGVRVPPAAPAFTVLAFAGYYLSRLTSTVAALLISDSPASEWLKLLALPFSVFYHILFNTLTLFIGYYRDAFGFGEPTTFAPERTLLRSNLSRFALAYRVRRAFLLAVRAARFGDVPFGRFWFGWKQSPFTPSGFEGWSTGKAPPPIFWPLPGSVDERDREAVPDPSAT